MLSTSNTLLGREVFASRCGWLDGQSADSAVQKKERSFNHAELDSVFLGGKDMITIICDKCGKIFACRPHYHRPGSLMTVLCIKCPVGGDCDYFGKTLFQLNKMPDTIEEGFCVDCL